MIEIIWQEFHRKLLNFITTKVNDRSIAEDILQEVFVQVIKNIDTLEDHTKLQPWLYQICRNKIIDYYRSRKLPFEYTDVAETLITDIEPEQQAFELHVCIRVLISDLPTSVSSILLASELDAIKQKEIAEHEGLSLSAVKSRLRRGRVLLKKKLLACCRIEFIDGRADTQCKSECGCQVVG
ncbi:sigma-70 family RNA polymerase sigma factor [Marinomonas transparens]|uniref:RNA polymerase sigma factor n=1 Tax=Marinomonas transparens TaxID=2795388 RepID=A0A934JVG1_9GAMM|nr:sigma-70 family RNA polymerase sigma factor [Marinomonas transparens]MBJ7538040.1 sigma-70 family RNA polymerase sigma factor [Marinomonas transparens]